MKLSKDFQNCHRFARFVLIKKKTPGWIFNAGFFLFSWLKFLRFSALGFGKINRHQWNYGLLLPFLYKMLRPGKVVNCAIFCSTALLKLLKINSFKNTKQRHGFILRLPEILWDLDNISHFIFYCKLIILASFWCFYW